jgi:hypothetical protein
MESNLREFAISASAVKMGTDRYFLTTAHIHVSAHVGSKSKYGSYYVPRPGTTLGVISVFASDELESIWVSEG